MTITERDLTRAEKRLTTLRRSTPAIVDAVYDSRRKAIVIRLDTGVELTVPTTVIEGLAGAPVAALREIEIETLGLALRWPKLDVDLYLPGLLSGATGTRRFMAARLGEKGGASKSQAKTDAARRNGRHGGRPKKPVAA